MLPTRKGQRGRQMPEKKAKEIRAVVAVLFGVVFAVWSSGAPVRNVQVHFLLQNAALARQYRPVDELSDFRFQRDFFFMSKG